MQRREFSDFGVLQMLAAALRFGMTRRRLIAVLGPILAAMSLVGCSGEPATKIHQKLTVEIDSPSGIRSGYAVVEVGNHPKPDVLKSIPGNGYSVRGEAVVIDIAPGKTLFALLTPPDAKWGDTSWYQAELINNALAEGAADEPSVKLPPQLYPLLVTFRDIRDPKSVERVDPAALDKSFGAGVTLRRITVAVTDDPVTTGIEKRLGWLARSEDGGLDPTMGVTANPTLAQRLSFLDFRRK